METEVRMYFHHTFRIYFHQIFLRKLGGALEVFFLSKLIRVFYESLEAYLVMSLFLSKV